MTKNKAPAKPIPKHSVLVVDDEDLVAWSIQQELEEANYRVYVAPTASEGLQLACEHEPDVILLDIMLPDRNGIDVLKEIRSLGLSSVVIMLTALSDINHAVQSVREGAFDFIPKPFELEDVKHRIQQAIQTKCLESEVHTYRSRQLKAGKAFIAESQAMQRLVELIRVVATQSTSTVLLTGESGVGKDFVATTIHAMSPRAHGPFIEIHCPSFPPHLLESELFGHERGAFTDAKSQKRGLLEIAQGGTAFLNEIGDIDATVQAKLLQVLEKKTFRRIGGTREISVDVRIIVATNRDLRQAIQEGRFREDLYYRLNVIPIHIPPLRERLEDIPPLAIHFVDTLQREVSPGKISLHPETVECLKAYSWPGNVRELRNVIERAILLSRKPEIRPEDLPPEISSVRLKSLGASIYKENRRLAESSVQWGPLEQNERNLIINALREAAGNQSKAARILGISRDTLRYRLKKYFIPAETLSPD